MIPYLKEYRWANIFAMIRNLQADPKICRDDFAGRLAVITGATSGIGYAAARKYASNGADLLVINRNESKSIELCNAIRAEFNVRCEYFLADFSRLSDIHSAAQHLAALERDVDVLIHNAGVYITRKTFTRDGFETVFQTNYLSTFIINHYLREKLVRQQSGRIIFVNSEAHRFAAWGIDLDDLSWQKHRYSGLKSYAVAKMAQLLSMIKLSEAFTGTGITINAMHPGNIKTNSGQNNNEWYKFLKRITVDRSARPIEVAAEALYYLGVSKELENVSGKFFNLTTEEIPAPPALDHTAAERLWELSMKMGQLYGNE